MNAVTQRGVLAAMMEGLSLPQPPRISIQGGMFTLVARDGSEMACNLVDQQVGRYLDIVIADANRVKSKIFYEDDWNPQSSDPPVCWSDNGIAPSIAAITPQSQTCDQCQWNVRGSDTSKLTGKAIKACQDRKKLAVYVVGDPNKELYQLQVTPAALKGLAAFGKWVAQHPNRAGTGPADPSELVTRIYFVPGQQGVLGFGAVGPIDDEMNARIDQAFAAGKTLEITGADDKPIQHALTHQPAQAIAQQVPEAQPRQQWTPPAQQLPPAAPAPVAPPPPPQPIWNGTAWVLPTQQVAPQPAQQQFVAARPVQQPAFTQGASAQPTGAPAAMQPATPAASPSKRGGARAGAGRKGAAAQQPPGDPNQPAQAFGQVQQPAAPVAPFQALQPSSNPGPTTPYPAPTGEHPGVPAFLQRSGTAPANAPVAPGPAQFGMAPAGAPSNDMSAALDRAFGTSIPKG